MTLPGGASSPSGSSTVLGANFGLLYNFRLDRGRSVFSAGATFGPRLQFDTIGATTFRSGGAFFGLTAGAAF